MKWWCWHADQFIFAILEYNVSSILMISVLIWWVYYWLVIQDIAVAIIIIQFLADNTLFEEIYQQPQAIWGGLIRFCNGIENCPGTEDYLTWLSGYCNVMQYVRQKV